MEVSGREVWGRGSESAAAMGSLSALGCFKFLPRILKP